MKLSILILENLPNLGNIDSRINDALGQKSENYIKRHTGWKNMLVNVTGAALGSMLSSRTNPYRNKSLKGSLYNSSGAAMGALIANHLFGTKYDERQALKKKKKENVT